MRRYVKRYVHVGLHQFQWSIIFAYKHVLQHFCLVRSDPFGIECFVNYNDDEQQCWRASKEVMLLGILCDVANNKQTLNGGGAAAAALAGWAGFM